jgi:uncharacterized protein (DUF2147 family)
MRAGLPAAVFIMCTAVAAISLAAAEGSLAGRWITYDAAGKQKRSVIEIVVTGSDAKGRITELYLQPGEDADPVCHDCPGDARNRKIRGLEILALRADPSGGSWHGTVLDPEEGRVYKCVAKLAPDGKRLELRGYVGFEIFGRSEVWSRGD